MPVGKSVFRIYIEGDDIDLISKSLLLSKRYIEEHRSETGVVDEFQMQKIDQMIESMDRYWNI